MIEGNYYGEITINSNDPYESQVILEVYFTVGDVEHSVIVNIIGEWNMVGLPVGLDDTQYQSVFPSSIDNTLYAFGETGYLPETDLEMGMGYWLRFTDPESVTIMGIPVENLSISMIEGWNMISGISFPILVDYITDPGNIIIQNTVYGYSENGYANSSVLNPGYGYWIRTGDAGEIQLSSSNRAKTRHTFQNKLKDANRLTINGKSLFFGVTIPEDEEVHYSLPPKPPAPSTDIRFFGDTKLCTTDDCVIEIMNNSSPLTFEIEIKDGETWEIIPVIANQVKLDEAIYLTDENQFTLNSNVEQFILRKSTSPKIPSEFALFPAYPNPFNPVTTIQFTVPELYDVNLSIYDIQGKLVVTLVNEQLSLGNHSVQWNAVGLSSGMYFILLDGSGNSKIQKVVLMK